MKQGKPINTFIVRFWAGKRVYKRILFVWLHAWKNVDGPHIQYVHQKN